MQFLHVAIFLQDPEKHLIYGAFVYMYLCIPHCIPWGRLNVTFVTLRSLAEGGAIKARQ